MIEDTRVGRAWRHVVGPEGDLFEADAISESSWLTLPLWPEQPRTRSVPSATSSRCRPTPETLKAWIKWMLGGGATARRPSRPTSLGCASRTTSATSRSTRARSGRRSRRLRDKAPQQPAAPLMAADLKDIREALNIKKPADCRDAVACITSASCAARARTSSPPWTGSAPGPPSNGRKGYMREVRGGLRGGAAHLEDQQEQGRHTSRSPTATRRACANGSTPGWRSAGSSRHTVAPRSLALGHIGQTRLKSRAICDLIRRRVQSQLLAGGTKRDRRLRAGAALQRPQPARRHGLHHDRPPRRPLEGEGPEPAQVDGHAAGLRAHRRGPARQRGEGAQAVMHDDPNPAHGQADEVRQPGTALRAALEAIARLTDLRRPRSRVLHRRQALKRVLGSYNTEVET